MNFIPAVVESPDGHVKQVWFGSVSLPTRRTFGVRPEHLSIAPGAEADFHGRVEIVEELGAESLVYLQTEFSADPVTIRISPEQYVQLGDEMPVRVERERFHLFGATGVVL